MNNQTILLVEDTAALAGLYADILKQEGYDVVTACSGRELFDMLQKESFEPSLLIIDVKLPDMSGLDILTHLKQHGFNAPVIVMTGHASINIAVESMQLGAADFLVKPFHPEKFLASVGKALHQAGLLTKANLQITKNVAKDLSQTNTISLESRQPKIPNNIQKPVGFIGTSPSMRLTYKVIESAAKSNAPVFITGESGTGKELCAEALHRLSRRASKPFIAINCAAIPRDLLETELFGHVKGAFTSSIATREGAVTQAQGGTLFLDEVAEMAPDMQTKLLRFLQNLTYQKVGGNKQEQADVRILCATNRDPLEEIKTGRLRQDLYYRLHVIPIHMPPLRERTSDIIDLAHYFLKLYGKQEHKKFNGFSSEAERVLLAQPWDGNVRELQNIVRGIVVLNDDPVINITMLPPDLIRKSQIYLKQNTPHIESGNKERAETPISPLWKIEQSAIENAIQQCGGNIPRAAALLQVSPSTIYRKKQLWEKQGNFEELA